MTRQITYIILILIIFNISGWAEETSPNIREMEMKLELNILILFFAFILAGGLFLIGASIIDDSLPGGIVAILAGVIIFIAALGSLDGLANILDKITDIFPWSSIKK